MPRPLFTGVNHLGIVTRDLDRAVHTWWERYGVGPWRVYRYDAGNMSARVDGRPVEYEMRVALAQLGPAVRVEIIEPLDERSPYAESLTRHGDADHLHHVRLDVADFEAAYAHLRQLGLPTRMHATFAGASPEGPRVTAAYLGTEAELGFMLEVVRMPAGFSMPEPEYVHPPHTDAAA
jgi:methylmalonyl-CoA/ethylmalonyl-CoA epimerase